MISNQDVLPALLRNHFSMFLRFAVREIGGEGELQWNFHLDAIIHQLERVRKGDNLRLIITIPPRHLKSIMLIAWEAWMIGRNPAAKFICASYGADLSEKHARYFLKILLSAWFRRAFPGLGLTRQAIMHLETSAGGHRIATSVGGVLTGIGADYVIIDDPMKADDTHSESARAAVKSWFDESLRFRLERLEHSAIILVMQRLHEDDLAGELLSRGGWHELRLSAIASSDELVEVGEGRFYQRREGCALHPARQSLLVLEKLRAENAHVFASQQQQDPVPLTGNYIDPACFQYYDTPPTTGLVVQSWDTASKTGLSNDYSVGITAIVYQRRFYLLDVHRERMDFGRLRECVFELCKRYKVDRLLIEDAASGQQLIQMLRPPPHPLPYPIACTPEGDKAVRFHAQASRVQEGAVVLPLTAPWLANFISEVAAFPNGRFDDQADAFAQLLRYGEPPYRDEPELVGPMIVTLDDPPTDCGDIIDDPWGIEGIIG
jgi:predicted phage terminase large subunit-like protein